MSKAFSLYVPRESGMHRLHPLTKLVLVIFCLVLGLFLPGVWLTYAAFALLLLPLAAWAGIVPQFLKAVFKTALPIVISLFLVQGLFWPNGTPIFTLGPLSLKQEGVAFATRSAGRFIMIVGSFLLLTFTTRPDGLMLALTQRGVPNSIAYVILATMQIVPRFQAKANTILDAQRSRGLETEGNLLVRLRALLPLIQPLLLGSIVDIEERAIALEVRAFGRGGPKTSLLVLHDTGGQRLLRWLLILAALAVIGWRLTLWLAPRLAA
ncbi:Cobalt transport protein [Candidatus Promineifilum breve]|uniref:Cobalt transport protein n=1 Tax=Candidatus Promineifilum breve TaxID=1806508 RepID=A0A160T468_9CHLR|nr:energy-coupling factor transporter transmembrane component T [Candidatus Promineifilum breve]CUS04846.2 Cobalt transport protein [Candidatus Promineifilum breve]